MGVEYWHPPAICGQMSRSSANCGSAQGDSRFDEFCGFACAKRHNRPTVCPITSAQCAEFQPREREPSVASLRVNPQAVAKLQDEEDTGRQLAIRLGVDPSTANRVLRGRQQPGERFIAGLIRAFGVGRLLELFEIVDG